MERLLFRSPRSGRIRPATRLTLAAWLLPKTSPCTCRGHVRCARGKRGTPPLYGQITDRWVYGCLLPEEVHAELKARRSESQKMHQWLTDGGQGLLDQQISLVQSIANTSADMRDFEARMMLISGRRGQLGMVFPKAA